MSTSPTTTRRSSMLSIAPSEAHHHHQHRPHYLPPPSSSVYHHSSMPHRLSVSEDSRPTAPKADDPPSSVMQALEVARESSDGAADATICKILDQALTHIWDKVQDHPDDYVMSRDEFAIFNYFQNRFTGNRMAVAARKRYWDNASA